MSRIGSRDTKPELLVRRTLHALGYRYRLYVRHLPGKPDLVFASRKKVVFVHGCYWHGHACKLGRAQSKSNVDFWRNKLASNTDRDRRTTDALAAAGYRVHIIWECEIKSRSWLPATLAFLGIPGGDNDAASRTKKT
jgi:DNA mismatch endonuclease (patch repair protein)